MRSPIDKTTVAGRFGPRLCLCLLFPLLSACHTAPQSVSHKVHASRPPKVEGPNILIIIGDDHAGSTLGIDGDPRQATPSIDRLARQGVRFDRAFCNSPVCTPSRQAFITGRLPHATGVTRLNTPLSDEEVTMGDWFGDLGYATAAYGKMHFNREDLRHGFQDRIDQKEYRAFLKQHPLKGGDHHRPFRPFADPARVWLNAEVRPYGVPLESMETHFFVDQAVRFFERQKARRSPFLLVVGSYDPHAPFKFPNEWPRTFRADSFEVSSLSESDRAERPKVFADLTPAESRGIQAAYFTSIGYLDSEVGRLLDALDRAGLAEDTIVVYLGDNGYMLGQHGRFEKHCMYEPAVRVPLILRWPGHLPAGRKTDEMVELVDVLPTLLELAGKPKPPDLHGRSLVDLLRGKPDAKGRETVFSEYLENEEAMIRSDRYKLIVGTGRRHRLDGYETGRPLPGPYRKLFDVADDPGETKNLVDRPDLASTLDRLEAQMLDRLSRTRNPDDEIPPGLKRLEAIHWCLRPRD